MFEIMQDNDTVMVEMDMLYKMDAYMEMRKVRNSYTTLRNNKTVRCLLAKSTVKLLL